MTDRCVRQIAAFALVCLAVAPAATAQPAPATTETALPEVQVTAPATSPYVTPNTATVVKTDTPIRDIPQAVRIIPSELLHDQGADSLNDVLRNVAGISPVQNRAGATASANLGQIRIRGFRSATYRDGIRERFFNDVDAGSLYNTQRVEVLKGPGSPLYGLGTLGGLLNYVTKVPQATPSYVSKTTLGSDGGGLVWRQGIDLTGPLNEAGTLLYRVNGEFERSDLFQDNEPLQRRNLGATLLYDNKSDTTVRLDIDARDRRQALNLGAPFPFTAKQIPISRDPGEPGLNYLRHEGIQTTLDAVHQFNDVWSARTVLRYDYATYHFAGANATSLRANRVTLNRTYNDYREFYNEAEFEQDVVARTNLFGHPATTLVGVSYSYLFDRSGAQNGSIGTLSLERPLYGRSRVRFTTNNYPIDITQNQYGLFIQQEVQPTERLRLSAGLRYDIETETDRSKSDGGRKVSGSNNDVTYRFGAIYDLWNPLSVYATYATSFTPTISTQNLTTVARPQRTETGDQYEIGLKLIDDNRYTANLGLFQITRSNVQVTDPNSDIGGSRTSGKQQSRGVDVDVAARISRGLSVTASYAYIYADVLEDSVVRVGNLLNNVPRHQGSFWVRYDFPEGGVLDGVFVGGGGTYVGDRKGDLANTFSLGSYETFNAVLGKRWRHVTAQLNIKNLTDRRYYVYADRPARVYPGEPRSILATLRVGF